MATNWQMVSVLAIAAGGVGAVALTEYGNIRLIQSKVEDLERGQQTLIDEYIAGKALIRDLSERVARVEVTIKLKPSTSRGIEVRDGVFK